MSNAEFIAQGHPQIADPLREIERLQIRIVEIQAACFVERDNARDGLPTSNWPMLAKMRSDAMKSLNELRAMHSASLRQGKNSDYEAS